VYICVCVCVCMSVRMYMSTCVLTHTYLLRLSCFLEGDVEGPDCPQVAQSSPQLLLTLPLGQLSALQGQRDVKIHTHTYVYIHCITYTHTHTRARTSSGRRLAFASAALLKWKCASGFLESPRSSRCSSNRFIDCIRVYVCVRAYMHVVVHVCVPYFAPPV
jgi:hypothetical protein